MADARPIPERAMTPAGKRLLIRRAHQNGIDLMDEKAMAVAAADILAIETEATVAEQARIAGEYRKLRGYPPTGPGSGDEVLAIIERRGRYWDGVIRS